MRTLPIALVLFFSNLFAHPQSPSVLAAAHKTTHHTSQETAISHTLCSATAVGPYALLTATHCEKGSDEIDVEGIQKTLHIVGKIRDNHDHTIYLISGTTFKDYACIDESNPLQSGEEVFIFGNPGDWSDMYRRGYVMGRIDHNSFLSSGPTEVAFKLPTYHGDSGAAIFSQDGAIIGVITRMEQQGDVGSPFSLTLTVGLELSFTPKQLLRAETFGVPSKDK